MYSDAMPEFVCSEDGKAAQKNVWKELEEKLEAIQPLILAQIRGANSYSDEP